MKLYFVFVYIVDSNVRMVERNKKNNFVYSLLMIERDFYFLFGKFLLERGSIPPIELEE